MNAFPEETQCFLGTKGAGRCVGYCIAHLWIVTAEVEGVWRLDQRKLIIKQAFQVIRAFLKVNLDQLSLSSGGSAGEGGK
jgi:hypothetical protein